MSWCGIGLIVPSSKPPSVVPFGQKPPQKPVLKGKGPNKQQNAPVMGSWIMWPIGCFGFLVLLVVVVTYSFPGNPVRLWFREQCSPLFNWNRSRTLPIIVSRGGRDGIMALVRKEAPNCVPVVTSSASGGWQLNLWLKLPPGQPAFDFLDYQEQERGAVQDALAAVVRPATRMGVTAFETTIEIEFKEPGPMVASTGQLDLKKVKLNDLGPYDIVPIERIQDAWHEYGDNWDRIKPLLYPTD